MAKQWLLTVPPSREHLVAAHSGSSSREWLGCTSCDLENAWAVAAAAGLHVLFRVLGISGFTVQGLEVYGFGFKVKFKR